MKRIFFCVLMLNALFASAQETVIDKSYEQEVAGSSVKFKMLPIPAGSFGFGSPSSDKLKDADETPQHKVSIEAFWMGEYEVTYDEFNVFFTDNSIGQNIPTDAITRPSSPYIDMTLGMGKQGGFPANSMQQFGAIMYCKWLYEKTGIFYRLPSEAEWNMPVVQEQLAFFPGDDLKKLDEYAWYQTNSENKYHRVGLKKPNAWGLYDMLGNVGEWVLDQYQADWFTTIADGTVAPLRSPNSRHPRTVKGGTFRDPVKDLRPASRTMSDLIWNRRDPQIPKSRWWNADAPFIGFRIIRPVKQPSKEEIETFFKTYLGS